MPRIIFASGVALALGFVSIPATSQSQRATQHFAFVSVVDKNDVPTSDLRSDEVRVLEDGIARPVLRVEPATDPMQTVLSGGMGLEPVTSLSESSPARLSEVTFATDANDIVQACDLLLKSHATRPVVLADLNGGE